MRTQEHYNEFIDNIDNYIRTDHLPYGTRMVQQYTHMIKSKLNDYTDNK